MRQSNRIQEDGQLAAYQAAAYYGRLPSEFVRMLKGVLACYHVPAVYAGDRGYQRPGTDTGKDNIRLRLFEKLRIGFCSEKHFNTCLLQAAYLKIQIPSEALMLQHQ